MNLKQLIKFGLENSSDPVIKNPVLRSALEKPRSMAQGGRIRFAKAGLADKANNVVKGQDLGDGIIQKYINGKFTYTAQHGSTSAMKDKGGMPNYKTLKEAKDRRAQLIKDFGEIDYSRPEARKYTWENFSKDPEFEEFFKKEITENPNIKAVAKKYKLGEDNLKELFDKVVKEANIAENVKKGTKLGAGKEKLININTLSRLDRKFNYTYKPRLGTVGTKELAKYMDMTDKAVTKLMAYIDKPSPDPLYAKTKAGILEEGTIKRANKFRDRLKEIGIDFFKPATDPTRVRSDLAGKKSKGKWRFRANPEQLEELGKFRIFKKAGEGLSSGKKNIFSALSKQSDEYKKFGYSKDRTAVNELASAMNRSFDAMSDSELKNFIKKNPKLRHLVEMTFDGITGDFGKIDIDKMSADQIRQFSRMEVDHIRGRSTVKFDEATKKILDGLDLEYPKNLYVVPNGINVSVKQKVENWIADYPEAVRPGSNSPLAQKYKNIDKVFKDAKISYWNRATNSYGGYKPLATAVDTTHLGTELDSLLNKYKTYIDRYGIERATAHNGPQLIAKLKQINESRMGKPNSALNELMQRTGSGIDPQLLLKAAYQESKPFFRMLKGAKGVAKWTGYGALAELGFMIPFAVGDYAAGKKWSRIIGNATDYGFGPIFGQSEQEEFEAALPKGSAAPQRRNIMELGERLSGMEQQKVNPGYGRVGYRQRAEDARQKVYDNTLDEYILNMQPFIRPTPHTEQGQFYDQYLMDKAEQEDIDAMNKIKQEDLIRKQLRDIKMPMDFMAAGGGIASIRRPNAIPPESGPTPQGLPSMYNRVRRI